MGFGKAKAAPDGVILGLMGRTGEPRSRCPVKGKAGGGSAARKTRACVERVRFRRARRDPFPSGALATRIDAPREEGATMKINLNVNGKAAVINADDPQMPLLYALRDDLGLNGPRFGCGL